MSARFSEPEAAEIDAARGTTDRSAWLRTAALIVARGKRTPRPEPVYVNTETPEPERKPKNCKHPNFRGVKGVCPDCSTWVGK